MPIGIGDDDLAWVRLFDRGLYHRQHVGKRASHRQVDAPPTAFVMKMAIAQSRHNHSSAQIDDLRVLADIAPYRLAAADRQEMAVLDGKTLSNRRVGIDGEDLAVHKHCISRPVIGGPSCGLTQATG